MMGRQKHDPTALHSSSSIALLQERFRQLQRVKEMREERELLRGFPTAGEAERTSLSGFCEQQQPKRFFHSDLVRPSRPLYGPPPSLLLDNHRGGDRPEFQALETSLSMGLWHNRSATSMQNSNNCSETDVDTSLHL